MGYREGYTMWCTDPCFDQQTKAELEAIAADEKEIEDRFYRNLEFGTGGLRGVIGAGTNRMNIYTVRRATQGLADYIIQQGGQKKGVVIAFDSRRMSPEFAREAALCLCANGIAAYLFESLRPTPQLSLAVRELGCIAGVVITASHNPAEYNGYKVYWEDGAQITPPHDQRIMEKISAINDLSKVSVISDDEAASKGLLRRVGQELDDLYIERLKEQSIHPEYIKAAAETIKIVYTPLHGAGDVPVRRVLRELGFEQVYIVSEQQEPDGRFPTVASPNPEDEAAWTLALKLAEEKDADIIFATDPDADRLGVYVKDAKTGTYVSFTGNMSGMMIAEYILRERSQNHTLPENPAVVETIVTTDMLKPAAAAYGVHLEEVLTGFKYIGQQIREYEEKGTYNYVFGLEESYGCLAGTYARDKDACVAVMLLGEIAAYYKLQGKTLWDGMIELYEKYGYYREGLLTLTMKGVEGGQKIRAMMEQQRRDPYTKIGTYEVAAIRDYAKDRRTDMQTGQITSTGLPCSDVLYYELTDGAWCCIRPSGTEPKIKFYCGVKAESLAAAEQKLDELKQELCNLYS